MGVQRKRMRRFIDLSAMKINRLFLLVITLLLLSGSLVTAGPIGDFFRKVGQSIPRPRQHQQEPEPQPQQEPQPARPQPAKTPNATRRSSSRAASAAAATSPAEAQSARASKEEEPVNTVRTLSAAELEKVKAGLPYGVPVPGRKGMVTSPYTPEDEKYIDVSDFATGSIVKDPYTGKFFLVP
jgi:hypothetical protein